MMLYDQSLVGFRMRLEPTLVMVSLCIALVIGATAALLGRGRSDAVVPALPSTTAAVPSVPAPRTAFPSAATTGVPAGTILSPVSGNITVTVPGTVIDAQDVKGCILIRADRVTVRRTRVRSAPCDNRHQIDVENGRWSGVLIEDVEIDGLKADAYGAGIGNSGFTCRRCDIHNVGQGANISSDVVIEDSFIHDLYSAGDPATTGSHNEPIISNGGGNFVIRRNELQISPSAQGASAAVALYGDFSPIVNVLVEGNRFNGGGYCIYGGSVPGKPHPVATGVRFLNNRFGQKYYSNCGLYGPATAFDAAGAGSVWSGNVFDSSGAVVSP